MRELKEYIECGKILGAHGVRGLVKVESWCDSAKVLAARKRVFILKGGEYLEREVKTASAGGDTVIMDISIPSREEAQGMKGTVLYLKRCDIPLKKGAVLLADIIGLPVIDVDTGREYGICSEINDGVQSRLYTVKTENGEVLIPDRPEFIKSIDTENGIFIKPIPGFFD